MNTSDSKTTVITVRLDGEDYGVLQSICDRTKLSQADVIRIAIRHWSNHALANGFSIPVKDGE